MSSGDLSSCLMVSMGVGMTPDLPVPQTALVVQAVKKDQEGDAAAALSLYCKALDFFVPALHCECLEPLVVAVAVAGGEGASAIAAADGFQKQLPIQNFVGDKAEGKSWTGAFGDSRGFGVGRGPLAPHSSHKPSLCADEVDAQRKEAIKAKVGE